MPVAAFVLVLAVVFGVTASAATVPAGDAANGSPTVVVTPTFDQVVPATAQHLPEPVPGLDPLDRSAGHAMWDPIGGGCVDGGDPDEPFPSGKADVRAPAFCLPQPCARILTPDELAREVLGRALRPDEWDAYVSRYAEACRHEAVWPVEKQAPDWVAGRGTRGHHGRKPRQ